MVWTVRLLLIAATLVMTAASFFVWPAEAYWAMTALSGAIAVYATLTLIGLLLAFGRARKELATSTERVQIGSAVLLLVIYPLYRIALIFLPLSLSFLFLSRAAPEVYFSVPAVEDNILSFLQRTAEALIATVFPQGIWWRRSEIEILPSGWQAWIVFAMQAAPVAAIVELARTSAAFAVLSLSPPDKQVVSEQEAAPPPTTSVAEESVGPEGADAPSAAKSPVGEAVPYERNAEPRVRKDGFSPLRGHLRAAAAPAARIVK